MDLPIWARIFVGIGLAAAFAYMTTPVAIQAARRFAFYDKPVGYKGHAAPTPYLGGAAVILAFVLAVLVGAGHTHKLLPLLGCVGVLLIVGTIDDRRNLSPGLRAGIELLLGGLLSVSGLGWKLGAGGAVDAAVTGVWVVAVVNAFNLFDNMDGQASTMALVAAGGVCVLSAITGDAWVAAGSAALCGACLGFLPYNLTSPARIFLGDGGSMPLGFAVAALVANAARSAEPDVLALLAGVLLVGLPVLDTSLVIISRRRRGVSILTGGRDHLTHRTQRKMRTARRVALVLGSTQALLSSLVIIATRAGSTAVVYIVLGFIIVAASAIVALDNVPIGELATIEESHPVASLGSAMRTVVEPRRLPIVALIAVVGFGAGASSFFGGFYDTGVWLTIGLVLVVVAAAVTIARPPAWTRPMALVLVGLTGLGLLALLSTAWSESVESATVAGNRWLMYAAFAIVAYALARKRSHHAVLLGSVGVGVALVAASVLVRMLGSGAENMFIDGRLNSPLGYINGQGCVFAMGVWLGVAMAERKQPIVAGAGAFGAVVMASLALLSQSRGAAIATAVTALIAITVIPGSRRRILTLTFIAAGIAVAATDVIHVYTLSGGGPVIVSSVHTAARVILLAAVGCGVLWGLAVWGAERFGNRDARSVALSNRLATIVATAVIVLPIGVAAVKASSIEHTIKNQWHAFIHLSGTGSSQSRLVSGAGNRYDYWRVAWNVFTDHPLAGVGAGNYPEYYYLERRTTEAIENPHSIELETLAEQGILGGLLLAALIAGIVIGVIRMRRRARESIGVQTLMVAAVGLTSVWFIDTSGDWEHLLPGVSAMALAAIVVLCRHLPVEPAAASPGPVRLAQLGSPRLRALAGIAVVVFALAIAGASLLRSDLANRYLTDANGELAHHPASAVADANRSLRLDSANLSAYYVKAAGQARFDEAAAAHATLLAATRQDPGQFVTWVLLGDLEVRLGNITQARGYYDQAAKLDPNDPSVAALVANPASALVTNSPGG